MTAVNRQRMHGNVSRGPRAHLDSAGRPSSLILEPISTEIIKDIGERVSATIYKTSAIRSWMLLHNRLWQLWCMRQRGLTLTRQRYLLSD